MNEEQIAQNLQSKIADTGYKHTPAPELPPEHTGFGGAKIELDELMRFKLSDFFGEKFDSRDEIARQQSQYIFEKVSEMTGTNDYPFVLSKMREIMRIAGITHSDNKRYKLYQFIKLNNIMRRTNAEMEALRDA